MNKRKESNHSRIDTMKNLYKEGKSLREIGQFIGLSRQRVSQLLKGKIEMRETSNRKLGFSVFYKFQCLQCSKQFERQNKGKNKFCSKECRSLYNHEKYSDKNCEREHKKGRKYPIKKYVRIITHYVNGQSRYRYEHRLVMEKHLGRKLNRLEHIHHIDGNGLNNELSNLELISAGEHGSITSKKIESHIYLGKEYRKNN